MLYYELLFLPVIGIFAVLTQKVLVKKLGLKFNFAMMLLPDEMYRSAGRKYKVTFGKPVSIASLDKSKSDFEWAQEIRKSVYEL